MTAIATENGTLAVTIQREALREAIAATSGALARRDVIPALRSFLVESDEGGVSITATDLDHRVTRHVPAEVKEPGAILLPFESFTRLLKDLPPEPVTLRNQKEGSRVSVRCGSVNSTLVTLPADEFPSGDMGDGMATAGRLPMKEFRALAGRATYAVSREESRPTMNGVLCELREDSLGIVSLDGYRMAITSAPLESGTDIGDVIVSPATIEHVLRCFGDDDDIEIARSETAISFRSAGHLVAARMVIGPYPAYGRAIPSADLATSTAVADRVALLSAARRAMSVSFEHQYKKVRLTLATRAIEVAASQKDRGSVDGSVTATVTGDLIKIGVNGSFLVDALSHLPGDDVRLRFAGPRTAIVITPEPWNGPGECTAVVVPLTLDDDPTPAAP